MRRIRKWLMTAVVAAALLLPLATAVSADPGDAGWGNRTAPTRTTADPGDGGWGH